MAKYRKKPVVIEAVKASDVILGDGVLALPEWLVEPHKRGDFRVSEGGTTIKTLEGVMRVEADDFIICGVKGELYPCKPDIFTATYDAIGHEVTPMPEEPTVASVAVANLLRFFSFEHLPPHLREVSEPFCALAYKVADLPDGAEKTVALRKLLEAKDCAVRTMVK